MGGSLTDSNSKLGPLIHAWSLPAGARWTCPGESGLCRTRCYAKRGFFRMPSVSKSHLSNYEASQSPEFASWMVQELRHRVARVVRVHVSGDFYSSEYTAAWRDIISRSRNCEFFAYTRSWRVEEIFPDLVRLSSLPNMQLWWSLDRETGPAPVVRGIRRAYMAIDDADASTAPDDCDLVFRDGPKTVMKKANGVMVCPPENGVHTQHKITCTKCGICWKPKTPNWEVPSNLSDLRVQELIAPALAVPAC